MNKTFRFDNRPITSLKGYESIFEKTILIDLIIYRLIQRNLHLNLS